MHWAFEFLGLEQDADERAIKRAYAARLKQARPDTDPEAFQALNEAYQAALAWLKQREATSPEPEALAASRVTAIAHSDGAASIDADSNSVDFDAGDFEFAQGEALDRDTVAQDAARDEADEADFDGSRETIRAPRSYRAFAPPSAPTPVPLALIDDCLARAMLGDAPALRAWLDAQAFFWSLSDKAQFGSLMYALLERRMPPISRECFDVLAVFFGFIDVADQGYALVSADDLRRRLHLAWSLRDPDLAPIQDAPASRPMPKAEAALVRQLRRPLRTWRSFLSVLTLGRPSAIAGFLQRNGYRGPWDAIDGVDPAQAAFWSDAADASRMSRARTLVGLARALVCGAFASLFLGLLSAPLAPGIGAGAALLALPAFCAIWLTTALVRCYVLWLPGRSDRGRIHDWPILLLPALIVVMFVAKYGLAADSTAILLNAIALGALFWRWLILAKPEFKLKFSPLFILFLIPMVKGVLLLLALIFFFIEVGASVLFLAWAFEMWAVYGKSRRS